MINVKVNFLLKFKMVYLGVIVFILLSVCSSSANAALPFEDDFNTPGDDLNRDIWTSVEWVSPAYNPAFLGRTAIRNPKIPGDIMDSAWPLADNAVKIGTSAINSSIGVAKLRLDTYNPILPNSLTFWGSEIDTGNGHNLNDFAAYSLQDYPEGISFEARIRPFPNDAPSGIVTSVFAYGLRNETEGRRDEIDFEFLTKQGTDKMYLNYYANTADGVGNIVSKSVAGFNATQFNTVKINWFTDKIEWYVNDALIHAVNATDGASIPQGPMGLRLNIWAPNAAWDDAYDVSFQPVSNIADNRFYIYEVDYAKVNAVPEPISCALFLLGGGVLAAVRKMLG